jgi:hypothetical protein
LLKEELYKIKYHAKKVEKLCSFKCFIPAHGEAQNSINHKLNTEHMCDSTCTTHSDISPHTNCLKGLTHWACFNYRNEIIGLKHPIYKTMLFHSNQHGSYNSKREV